MKNQISFSQYRTIDLCILMGMLAFSQFLIYQATTFWFPDQLYVVSPVAGVTAMVMMRWSGYAGIHACLGGLVFTALSGGGLEQYLIYGAGNLLALVMLLMFRIFGKERIRKDAFLSIVFALGTQLLMQLGRAGISALLGHPAEVCIRFITTDFLSCLFTALIIWIIRRVEGLFEDQKHYLLRIQEEQTVERGEQF